MLVYKLKYDKYILFTFLRRKYVDTSLIYLKQTVKQKSFFIMQERMRFCLEAANIYICK